MTVKAFPLENEPMLDSEWRQLFKNLYKGVATGLEVTADGGGLRVFVAAGEGGAAGVGIKSTDNEQLAIAAGSGSARTDYVVLDSVTPHLKVVTSVTDSQYVLAEVTVSASAVTIAPGDVTNVSKTIGQELSAVIDLTVADIPNLPASKITTGELPIARGGTGATSASAARTNLGLKSGATRVIPGDIVIVSSLPGDRVAGRIVGKI